MLNTRTPGNGVPSRHPILHVPIIKLIIPETGNFNTNLLQPMPQK